MSDDVEQRMTRLTPHGTRPELRGQVLEAVASELDSESRVGQAERGPTTPPRRSWWDRASLVPPYSAAAPASQHDSPWLRRAAIAVAASLLLGIGLNVWASKASERHLARLFGPPPISKGAMEIAKTVEAVTDAETAQWVYRRLTAPRRPGDGAAAYAKYCDTVKRLVNELQIVSKDSYHETPQKDSEMDGDRTGRIGGHTTDCQRMVRMDYRCTA